MYACGGLVGSIEIAFVNTYKIVYIYFPYLKWNGSSYSYSYTSANVLGNINVFSDKYDLRMVSIFNYTNINGQLKDLKNYILLIFIIVALTVPKRIYIIKVLISLILLYNPTKTNLTSINLRKYPGGKYPESTHQFYYINGSVNFIQNHTHLYYISLGANPNISGNIEIMFNNHSGKGLWYILYDYLKWNHTNGSYLYGSSYKSTDFAGNINIFANKYDIEWIQIEQCSLITGEVKSLKNLKKFRVCYLGGCSCTGSKTDLWNQGANITWFGV